MVNPMSIFLQKKKAADSKQLLSSVQVFE